MSDRLFLDTNIVIDLLGERDPFYLASAKIASLADRGHIEIVVSSLTYANTFYILSKYEGKLIAIEKLRKFKSLSITSDLTDKIIEQGLVSTFSDFEDALQHFCALQSDCNILITRNGKDFNASEIPVLSPDEYLSAWFK